MVDAKGDASFLYLKKKRRCRCMGRSLPSGRKGKFEDFKGEKRLHRRRRSNLEEDARESASKTDQEGRFRGSLPAQDGAHLLLSGKRKKKRSQSVFCFAYGGILCLGGRKRGKAGLYSKRKVLHREAALTTDTRSAAGKNGRANKGENRGKRRHLARREQFVASRGREKQSIYFRGRGIDPVRQTSLNLGCEGKGGKIFATMLKSRKRGRRS